jgi:glucose/arabinose dehydrogenase
MKQKPDWNLKLRKLLIVTVMSGLAVGLLFTSISAMAAPILPPGFVNETAVAGLSLPTGMAWAPDGRMFITLKDGRVLVFQNGQLLPTPFIDISNQVNNYGDRGLLGIAIHPNFPTTPYVYLLFTYDPPDLPGGPAAPDGPDGSGERVNRLIRVSALATDTNVADPASEVVILGKNSTLANIANPASIEGADPTPSCDNNGQPLDDCLPSDSSSHSIGTVAFGTDGSLYVSNGEGATFINPDVRALRAQNLDSLGGKILRINPETGLGYPDNPFYDGNPAHNRSRVWSYGLRNPFRLTINPATNEPFVGDVGWYAWEEINTGRGKNFGWPCYEGDDKGSAPQSSYQYYTTTKTFCGKLYDQGPSAVQAPLYSWSNSPGAAAIAGTFYTGKTFPAEYQGVFFFADYVRAWIKYLTLDATGKATVHDFMAGALNQGGPVQLTVGPDGDLYYVLLKPSATSEIRRIRYAPGGTTPPTAQAVVTPTNGFAPLTATFSSAESSDPNDGALSYQWAFGDGITSTEANPTHVYTTNGTYIAVLTVTNTPGQTGTHRLVVTVGNAAPVATITAPAPGTTYNVGDTISFSGTGTDPKDGTLSGNSLTWTALLHHNDHIHYDFFKATGTSGSLVYPDHGDFTWLELCLTATDSGGLHDTKCVAIHPNSVVETFDTQPSGLPLVYDGATHTTPFTVETIVNSQRLIIAPPTQGNLDFIGWSDGGQSGHTVTIAPTPRTYVAEYQWLDLLSRMLLYVRNSGVSSSTMILLAVLALAVLGLAVWFVVNLLGILRSAGKKPS